MDTQTMVWAAGGVTLGILAVAQMMRRARFKRDLSPVSDQWLAEQRGRNDL
jgi:hypothetical protein